ncbi:cytochrome c biogenesis protein ResB [candidate division KSB1 bacterium]|nr:cytochrome c biogenesis protein ResB [candidate division KSB1 bacterium]
MTWGMWIGIFFAWASIGGFFCAYVAREKKRGPLTWFFLGVLFGLFALIALAALPRRDKHTIEREDESTAALFGFDLAVDKLWLFFSSVKLTIVLLLALASAMAYGTYIETVLSNGAARIVIYRTWWFDSLIVLLAINLIGCTLRRAPYRPHQVFWLSTHVALLILMAGSIITHRFGMQGQMVVPEGDFSTSFFLEELDREKLDMLMGQEVELPFAVWCDQFEQIMYPGSGMTRIFRSDVKAWEQGEQDTVKWTVMLNHPLVYKDYKISQASWIDLKDGRQATVLGVSYDPGIPFMYVGGILLILSMAGIFFVKPWLKQKFPPKPVRREFKLAEDTEMTAETGERVPQPANG